MENVEKPSTAIGIIIVVALVAVSIILASVGAYSEYEYQKYVDYHKPEIIKIRTNTGVDCTITTTPGKSVMECTDGQRVVTTFRRGN